MQKKKIKLSNSFMHWVRILLQGVQILGKDDRKATWLCCWANGLTLVKLLTRWKKKNKKKRNVCKLYKTLAKLQLWVKVTKTQNRPWVFTLQKQSGQFFALCVRAAVSAYCPQPQHVETAVQVFQRLIYSINHCGFFLGVIIMFVLLLVGAWTKYWI